MSEPATPSGPRPRAAALVALAGAAALMGAMATDFIAVVGRHTGLSLLGSIEVVQALVLVSGSAALVIATLERSHAVVSILLERLKPGPRAVLGRINSLMSALFMAAVACGSGWIALDMQGSHEVSELLGIPMAPLRAISFASAAACALLFVRQAFVRKIEL